MKPFYFIFIFLFLVKNAFSEPNISLHSTDFYNNLLSDQAAIEQINEQRPKIYIYTDFGGGKNFGKPIVDLQTSGELASAAWKSTIQNELYINDSAKPLSPLHAAIYLAKQFPYEEKFSFSNGDLPRIQTIVVHVIDPGVGNSDLKEHDHPRSLVLRKDGVLFIGPDNGSLSFVCPKGSIAGIWKIDADQLNRISGIDTQVGGTFHGRDLFSEAAFRLAANSVSLESIGIPYETPEIKNRTPLSQESLRLLKDFLSDIPFSKINTERFFLDFDDRFCFEKAFLLGIIQSPLFQKDDPVAQTLAKKFFIIKNTNSENLVAIINKKTKNTYIGPNNGLGTSFFSGFSKKDLETFSISREIFEKIKTEKNNERALELIKDQPKFNKPLKTIDFLGGEESLIRDQFHRPQKLVAKIWIDLYGNIKTTALSPLLDEAKQNHAKVIARLNDVEKQIIFSDTFSEVPEDQLFIYNGSTASFGQNPHRSERFVELTANGIYGKFGADFFEKNSKKPQSGQTIEFYFDYKKE